MMSSEAMLIIENRKAKVALLFSNLKRELPALSELLTKCNDRWAYEDGVYRFYHQSFKVYRLQNLTIEVFEKLRSLLPDSEIDEYLIKIIEEGTGKEFHPDVNRYWLETTRPIVEAFLHTKFFLEMAVKYGNKLESPPEVLPSGWAAFLYFYKLR